MRNQHEQLRDHARRCATNAADRITRLTTERDALIHANEDHTHVDRWIARTERERTHWIQIADEIDAYIAGQLEETTTTTTTTTDGQLTFEELA